MNIQPFGRRILIKLNEEKTQILSQEKQYVLSGEVLEVGRDCDFVQKGDHVLFTDFGIDKVTIDGQEYCFLTEDEETLLGKFHVS